MKAICKKYMCGFVKDKEYNFEMPVNGCIVVESDNMNESLAYWRKSQFEKDFEEVVCNV